jgi:hypothetical protein
LGSLFVVSLFILEFKISAVVLPSVSSFSILVFY